MIVAEAGGQEIDRTFGFVEPREFIKTVNDYHRGVGTLAALIADQPNHSKDPEFYYLLGTRYYAHSRFEEADDHYHSTVLLDPNNKTGVADDAMYERILVCRKLEKWDDGIGICKNLTSRWPKSEWADDADAYAPYLAAKAGRNEEAIDGYQDYLKKWPKGEDVEWVTEQITELQAESAEATKN